MPKENVGATLAYCSTSHVCLKKWYAPSMLHTAVTMPAPHKRFSIRSDELLLQLMADPPLGWRRPY